MYWIWADIMVGTMALQSDIISSFHSKKVGSLVFFCNTQRVVQLTWFKVAAVSLLTAEASCQCDQRLLKQGPFIFSSTIKLYQALCPAAIVSYSFVREYGKKWRALLSVTMGLAIYWRESWLQRRTRRAVLMLHNSKWRPNQRGGCWFVLTANSMNCPSQKK